MLDRLDNYLRTPISKASPVNYITAGMLLGWIILHNLDQWFPKWVIPPRGGFRHAFKGYEPSQKAGGAIRVETTLWGRDPPLRRRGGRGSNNLR